MHPCPLGSVDRLPGEHERAEVAAAASTMFGLQSANHKRARLGQSRDHGAGQ